MPAKLQICKIDSYIDEEVDIKVTGCSKNEKVTINATMYDDQQKEFSSYATFIANDEGVVNVSSQKPIEGTYNTIDGSGLFWSMEHAESKFGDYFEKVSSSQVDINLVLTVNGQKQDEVTIHRYFYLDDVKKEVVQHERIKGIVFHPNKNGRYPAIMILSGSDGGMQEHAAALLASKGYTALALPYFGTDGVPKDLENISLEYFQEATMLLKNHPYSNGEVGLIGYSRGGELALLLGSTFHDYKAVIAGAPSAYITAGMRNGIFAPVSSWSLKDNALRYIKFKYRFSTMFTILNNWIMKKPISYLSIWDHSLSNLEAIKDARIAVENIDCPLMFIAGGDDQLWPSVRYVKMMEDQLKNSKRDYEDRYLYYEKAGHFLAFPYSFVHLPANVYMNVGGGMTMTFGGTKLANAQAAKDSWFEIVKFLEENMS